MSEIKNPINEISKVRGYVKPSSSFHILKKWEDVALYILDLQGRGLDTRGGQLSCKHPISCSVEEFDNFVNILVEYFDYQLTTEVDRWELLTQKNVLDFIEDFVNHRIWAFKNEYGSYFSDIQKLKFAFFYSRGDLEPYVLLDDEYTTQLYGTLYNPAPLCHYTTDNGLKNLLDSIEGGSIFDISCFTIMDRPFFRPESNILVKLEGNVRAAFRSDIKSFAVDDGRRACNMYRLEYPGDDVNNICYDLDSCDQSVRTSLWNEYIATPIHIQSVELRHEDI